MSPLRSWFSVCFIRSNKRILIHCRKSGNPKRMSEGQPVLTRSLAHASGYQKPMPDVKSDPKRVSAFTFTSLIDHERSGLIKKII